LSPREECTLLTFAAYANQDDLIKALNNNDSEENIVKFRREMKRIAQGGLEKVFQEHKLDVIAAPADSPLCVPAAAAGKSIIIRSLTRQNDLKFGQDIPSP
jgi:amidase